MGIVSDWTVNGGGGYFEIDRKSGYTAHLTSSSDTPEGTSCTVTDIIQQTDISATSPEIIDPKVEITELKITGEDGSSLLYARVSPADISVTEAQLFINGSKVAYLSSPGSYFSFNVNANNLLNKDCYVKIIFDSSNTSSEEINFFDYIINNETEDAYTGYWLAQGVGFRSFPVWVGMNRGMIMSTGGIAISENKYFVGKFSHYDCVTFRWHSNIDSNELGTFECSGSFEYTTGVIGNAGSFSTNYVGSYILPKNYYILVANSGNRCWTSYATIKGKATITAVLDYGGGISGDVTGAKIFSGSVGP